jgi:hypothetical protein
MNAGGRCQEVALFKPTLLLSRLHFCSLLFFNPRSAKSNLVLVTRTKFDWSFFLGKIN